MITSISWYFTHGTMVVHPLLYQDTLSTRSQVYETMFLKKQLDHFDEYRGIKTSPGRYNEAVGAIRLLYDQWEIQDPTDGGTLVPYFWPYFVGIFPYNGHWNEGCYWFPRPVAVPVLDMFSCTRCPIQMTPMLEPVRIVHEDHDGMMDQRGPKVIFPLKMAINSGFSH